MYGLPRRPSSLRYDATPRNDNYKTGPAVETGPAVINYAALFIKT